eukprot:2342918-Pleurochrysis_carterae.AAC.1
MPTIGKQERSLQTPRQRGAYKPVFIDAFEPRYSLNASNITTKLDFSDIAVGIMASSVKDTLVQAARRTWMQAVPRLAVLLLVECACPTRVCIHVSGPRQTVGPHLGTSNSATESVVCYYRRYRISNAAKAQVLWNELFKMPRRQYYIKIDTDTLLQPTLMLEHVQLLHTTASSAWLYLPLLYFGKDEISFPIDFQLLSQQAWFTNFSAVLIEELAAQGETFTFPSLLAQNFRKLPYVQGGMIGLSSRALQLLVRTQCVRRLALRVHWVDRGIAHSLYAEDVATGICMHILGAPVLSSRCVHRFPACRCGLENITMRQRSCDETQKNTRRCRVRAISMHRLKAADEYERCWQWQQEALRFKNATAFNQTNGDGSS